MKQQIPQYAIGVENQKKEIRVENCKNEIPFHAIVQWITKKGYFISIPLV